MKIVYSRFFVEDLENMIDYISKELLNPVAADNLKSIVFKEIDRLKESPLLGESLSSRERVFNARQDWLCLVGEMTDNQKR